MVDRTQLPYIIQKWPRYRSNGVWHVHMAGQMSSSCFERLLSQKRQTYLSAEGFGHSERGGDPAEGVDDMRGKAADDALDGVAHELVGGDDEAATHQQRRGKGVVKTEEHAVGGDVLPLQVTAQPS